MPTAMCNSRLRSGCAHWDLDCEEEAAGEEAEEENSSDKIYKTLTWQVGNNTGKIGITMNNSYSATHYSLAGVPKSNGPSNSL